uniref:Tyrosine-protein kinase n=1 Tax=Caenorhabditis tropicalis TaxID=1561998 RepID=A0A1I7UHN8_9PELO
MSSFVFEEKVFKWLLDQKFYHGYLPREDLTYVLKKKGDYILRVTEVFNRKRSMEREIVFQRNVGKDRKKDIVLSIAWPSEPVPMISGKDIKSILIERNANSVWIEMKLVFLSIDSLLRHYRSNDIESQNKDRIKLMRPIGLFSWEFRHSQIQLIKKVGQGAYGEVYKGKVKKGTKTFDAAIKAMRRDLDAADEKMKEVMAEARLMRSLNHPNIVRCRGISVVEQPVYIVIDFITGGGLDSFLKKNGKTLSVDEKNKMAISAAWGIEFMHSHEIIHRDIAARNCLYDKKNLVKLSDFGLSRKGTVYNMKKRMKMPTKWLAPESLSAFTFSQASDVYTFGVLLYEIYTCQEPFLTMNANEARQSILSGSFPNFSKQAPQQLNDIVKKSIYLLDPTKRGTMKQIVKDLETWLEVELVLDEDEKPDAEAESNRLLCVPQDEPQAVKAKRLDPPTTPTPVPVQSQSVTTSTTPSKSRGSKEKNAKKNKKGENGSTRNETKDATVDTPVPSETISLANKMMSDAKRGSDDEMLTPPDEETKPSSKETESVSFFHKTVN